MKDKILSIQAEFLDTLAKVNTLKTDAEKREVLSVLQSSLNEFNVATSDAVTNLNQPTEDKPDLSQIPLWGGKIKDGLAIEWLEKHYGQWLKQYGADQNYIYRQDIMSHDEKLVQAVSNYMSKEKIRARDILPTRSDLVTSNAEKFNITPEIERTTNTIQRRKYKSQVKSYP